MRSRATFAPRRVRSTLLALLAGSAAAALAADPVPAPPASDAAPVPAQAAAVPAQPKIDAATVLRAAALVYTRDVQRARAANSIDDTSGTAQRIRSIAQRLIVQANRLNPYVPWTLAITVENEALPVAYCLPGGKIIASTALVDRLRLTDDELAALLAHAIGHAIAGHDADEAVLRLARKPDGIAADPNRTVLNLADVLAQLVHNEPHTVDAERVADSISLDLLLRAGIDPRTATGAWRKVARAGGAVPPGFLALNPTWPTRVDDLDAAIPAAIRAYEASVARSAPPPTPASPPRKRKAPPAG
jgi:predicted Zn-dependent protease